MIPWSSSAEVADVRDEGSVCAALGSDGCAVQGGSRDRFHSSSAGFMHRDTKLGLALGMLVIGFTVAFCFPRVTPPVHRLAVERVTADPALEFLPIRAYDVPAPPTSPRKASTAESVTNELVPVVGIFPGQAASNRASSRAATPGDVALNQESMSARGAQTVAAGSPVEQPATYTVQPGDTLSGIATRFLGNSKRYYEIFEANQNLLATPDALKIGMVLAIPGREPAMIADAEPQPTLAEQAAPKEQLVPVPDVYAAERTSRKYYVQPGDTLEAIARLHYGTTSVIPQIRQANPVLQDAEALRVGSVLELPVIR